MRDMTKKKANDRRRHLERMINDLDYRMRKLLNTIYARCNPNSTRKDREWYAEKNLEVTVTVEDLKALWWRDRADTMKRPTIDRKENHIGYVLENCRFIEHADNLRRAVATRRKRRWHRKPLEPTTEVA
jgi:hypothetical protein